MSTLSDKLRLLSTDTSIENGIFEEDDDLVVHRKRSSDLFSSKSSEKKEKRSVTEECEEYFSSIGLSDEDLSDEFDLAFEGMGYDEEDIELRNSLVALGRKYNRENAISAESSEIQKEFSGNEKKLRNLIEEIRSDKAKISEDLDKLRTTRRTSPKAISDTYEAKNTLHTAELNAIKELNSMKKTQIELSLKAKAQKGEDASATEVGGNLIKNLFNVGRKNMLSGVGGYAGISGATGRGRTSDDGEIFMTENERERGDDVTPISIDPSYAEEFDDFEDTEDIKEEKESSDGDKFLKYLNHGVHYVLDLTGEKKEVYAEDRDGNRIDDYPLPSNIDNLIFDIDDRDGTATDDLHRDYIVKR